MWDPAVVTAGFQKAIAVMTATMSDEPRNDSPTLATHVIASYVQDESMDGLVVDGTVVDLAVDTSAGRVEG